MNIPSVGDEVEIVPQVYWKGYNLSGRHGCVIRIETYYEVHIPSLNITAKLFSDEMEPVYHDISIFSDE